MKQLVAGQFVYASKGLLAVHVKTVSIGNYYKSEHIDGSRRKIQCSHVELLSWKIHNQKEKKSIFGL